MNRRNCLLALSTGVSVLTGCSGPSETAQPDTDTPRDTATGTATPTKTDTATDTEAGTETETSTSGEVEIRTETVATGFEIPWGAAYHDGTLYLTERPGRVTKVVDGERRIVTDLTDSTAHEGEGGLMGLVFHPDADTAYIYQTHDDDGLQNRILRFDAPDFTRRDVLFDGIPGASLHDGGRLAVSPDGALFATCGDAQEREKAQEKDVLNGKVLRLTPEGASHPDNPFGTAVFSYGHRNPQGLAFHNETLYSTEHGPQTDDEINRLEAGNNYGWPVVKGFSDREEFTDPLAAYTPTIAPASATFYRGPIVQWQGDFFFGTLAGEHLHRTRITADDDIAMEARHFEGEFGRIRTVFTGPADHLYMVTSNRDGRATGAFPREGDDRVIRVRPD